MANFHKLSVIGRLVSDPKYNRFEKGGGVAKFGLPIDFTRRKKNPQTGEWEGASFIINVDAFDSEFRKLGELVMQYLKKGSQVYVEGRLKENKYYSETKKADVVSVVLVADTIQFLDSREQGTGGFGEEEGEGMRPAPSYAPRSAPASRPAPAAPRGNSGGYDGDYESSGGGYSRAPAGPGGGSEEEIPF